MGKNKKKLQFVAGKFIDGGLVGIGQETLLGMLYIMDRIKLIRIILTVDQSFFHLVLNKEFWWAARKLRAAHKLFQRYMSMFSTPPNKDLPFSDATSFLSFRASSSSEVKAKIRSSEFVNTITLINTMAGQSAIMKDSPQPINPITASIVTHVLPFLEPKRYTSDDVICATVVFLEILCEHRGARINLMQRGIVTRLLLYIRACIPTQHLAYARDRLKYLDRKEGSSMKNGSTLRVSIPPLSRSYVSITPNLSVDSTTSHMDMTGLEFPSIRTAPLSDLLSSSLLESRMENLNRFVRLLSTLASYNSGIDRKNEQHLLLDTLISLISFLSLLPLPPISAMDLRIPTSALPVRSNILNSAFWVDRRACYLLCYEAQFFKDSFTLYFLDEYVDIAWYAIHRGLLECIATSIERVLAVLREKAAAGISIGGSDSYSFLMDVGMLYRMARGGCEVYILRSEGKKELPCNIFTPSFCANDGMAVNALIKCFKFLYDQVIENAKKSSVKGSNGKRDGIKSLVYSPYMVQEMLNKERSGPWMDVCVCENIGQTLGYIFYGYRASMVASVSGFTHTPSAPSSSSSSTLPSFPHALYSFIQTLEKSRRDEDVFSEIARIILTKLDGKSFRTIN